MAAHGGPARAPPRRSGDPLTSRTRGDAGSAGGFGPSCAWCLNDDADLAYAREAPSGGRLAQPVLFVNGDRDVICSISENHQGDPMRAACDDLTIASVPAGHWLPVERKAELVRSIRSWLQAEDL